MPRTIVLILVTTVLASLGAATSTRAAEPPCIQIWDPVCGINGETYSNSCAAEQAGMSAAYTGQCLQCGGIAGLKCPERFVCDLEAGQCGGIDLLGVCMPKPGDWCPEIYLPVCGCDGKTYGNDCERLKVDIQKDHNGSCMEKEQLPRARSE